MKRLTPRSGRPRTYVSVMHVRLTAEQMAAFDRWRAEQPEPKPARSEAVRYALNEWLIGIGYLNAPSDGAEAADPRDELDM